ncbi:MAG: translation initiation factor [Muribaculaceae bacterium]|nr:translation initiation factor [Muribaculaceae bacterium]
MSTPNDWKELLGKAYSISTEDIEREVQQEKSIAEKAKMKLRVAIDKKNRSGKTVTVVTGFYDEESASSLAKTIKTKLGTGGSVKDCEIVLQGDLRDKVLSILLKEGYDSAKKI